MSQSGSQDFRSSGGISLGSGLATAQVRRPVGNKSDSLSDKQLQIISEKHGGYDTSYQTVVTVLDITLYMHNKHKVVK